MISKQLIKENNFELISSTITWLRLPLIIGVVFIHMNQYIIKEQVDFLHLRSDDMFKVVVMFIFLISRIAVPCFFMFSGFLYYNKVEKWDKAVYINKNTSRIKTLIIPLILWNLIPIILGIANRAINGGLDEYLINIQNNGIIKVFWNYHAIESTNILGIKLADTYPYNISLWFLRDLIVLIIISPIIYYYIRYTKVIGIIFLSILYYIRIWFFTPDFWTTSLFFFSLGAYFSINKIDFITFFNKRKKVLFAIMILSFLWVVFIDQNNWQSVFSPIFIVSGLACTIIQVSKLLYLGKIKVNKTLSNASFFVYATHLVFILGFFVNLLDKLFASQSVINEVFKYISAPLLTSFFCVLIYLVLNKISPIIMKILTGSR